MNKIVIDLDGTITIDDARSYADKLPNSAVIQKMKEYKNAGFQIVIHTARNMRTFSGAVGKINIFTLGILILFLFFLIRLHLLYCL